MKSAVIKLAMVKNPNCEMVNSEESLIGSITNGIPIVLQNDEYDSDNLARWFREEEAKTIGFTTGKAFIKDGIIFGEVEIWDDIFTDLNTLEWANSMCEVVRVPTLVNTYEITGWDWFMYKRKDGSSNLEQKGVRNNGS